MPASLPCGGRPADLVTAAQGATALGIETAAHGVVTRGVLLDATALTDRDWLERGEAVHPEHLEKFEDTQGVRVSEGDAVLLYTGDGLRRRERGYEVPLLAGRPGRGVAPVGCDGGQGVLPSGYESLLDPFHEIGLAAMGLWLLDYGAVLGHPPRWNSNLGRWGENS